MRDLDRRLQSQRLSSGRLPQDREEDRGRHSQGARAATPIERVQRALALGKLAEVEEIEVDEAEVDGELERLTVALQASREALRKALDNPSGRRTLALDLLTEKAIRRVVAIARGEPDQPPSAAAQELHPGDSPAADQSQE